jgi:hypothetical protein
MGCPDICSNIIPGVSVKSADRAKPIALPNVGGPQSVKGLNKTKGPCLAQEACNSPE